VALLCHALLFVDPVFSGGSDNAVSGAVAPSFSLSTLTGEAFDLSAELRAGRVVLLNFWGLRCGACIMEMPALQSLARKYSTEVSFLGVNVDGIDAGTLRQQMTRMRLEPGYPVAPDPELKVADLYKLAGAPLTIVIDRAGAVRYRHENYEEGDEVKLDGAIASAVGNP
jgi:thiol-disulfide isomerase/thioredoxin